MEIEVTTRKLINIPDVEKYIFCPKNITSCLHLDRSILIYENGVSQFSCSNLEAINTGMPTVSSIQICPLFKLSNEEK